MCTLNTAEAPTTGAATPALPNPFYSRAWTCWAAGVIGTFAVLETAALLRAPGHGTLSAQLRRRRAVSAVCIAVFGCWAVHHIAWAEADS